MLKIGNCCWLVLLSVFPASCSLKKKSVDKKWSSSVAGRVLLFHLSYRYLTMSGEECSDQLPSYLCLHFFASL